MPSLKSFPARLALGAAILLILIFTSLSHPPVYDYASDRLSDLSALTSLHSDRLAQNITAIELIERPLTKDLHSIPRIFHQSWKTNEVPERFQSWSESCRRAHPEWKWVVWSNDDNRKLVEKHFGYLLHAYDHLKDDIFRADFARNLYMYLYGGCVVEGPVCPG
jgi:mannosyltransferase OCH1-like enzyme